MNLKMMNESFKRKYSHTLNESVNDSDKEQLRKALVLRSMNVVANGGNIKSLEIALQDVIENFYPDHCWWEVTDCQIFNELLGGCNPRQICDMIVDQLKPEFAGVEESLSEAAFSGGMAGDNSFSGGTIRGRGASTQPSKTSYLRRLQSKNPDLVDITTVKGKDIKPGMITQAGQVKTAEVKKNNRGETKVYIMHTNDYDGFWDVDEDMEVLLDPNDKSQPFTGSYRDLLKMGLQESFREWMIRKINEHLSRLNEAEMSDEDRRDSEIIRGMISKLQKRSNAKFTPEEKAIMQKYGITRDNWQKTLSVEGRPLHPSYDGKTSKTYRGWNDWDGVKHRNGDPSKINYADRARKLPQRADNQIAGIWAPNGSINAHTRNGDSTYQDTERALQADKDREPVREMERALWDRKYHQRQMDGAQASYDTAVGKARKKYDDEVRWATDQYRRDTVDASQRRDAAQGRIDKMLKRK